MNIIETLSCLLRVAQASRLFKRASRPVVFLTLLLIFLLASRLQAQVTPTTIVVLTNLPATVAAGGTTLCYGAGAIPQTNIINLRQGTGIAISQSFAGSSSSLTGAYTINWASSLDGTNYSTTNFIQTIVYGNGTTYQTGVTNLSSTLVNNELFLTPYSITNGSASGTLQLSNVMVGLGNLVPGGYP